MVNPIVVMRISIPMLAHSATILATIGFTHVIVCVRYMVVFTEDGGAAAAVLDHRGTRTAPHAISGIPLPGVVMFARLARRLHPRRRQLPDPPFRRIDEALIDEALAGPLDAVLPLGRAAVAEDGAQVFRRDLREAVRHPGIDLPGPGSPAQLGQDLKEHGLDVRLRGQCHLRPPPPRPHEAHRLLPMEG